MGIFNKARKYYASDPQIGNNLVKKFSELLPIALVPGLTHNLINSYIGSRRRPKKSIGSSRRTTTKKRIRNSRTRTRTIRKKKFRVRLKKHYVRRGTQGRTYTIAKARSIINKKDKRLFKSSNMKREIRNADSIALINNYNYYGITRWYYKSNITGLDITKAFNAFMSGNTNLGHYGDDVNYATNTVKIENGSGDNKLYIGAIRTVYELLNPTNYQMEVNIYDIVLKREPQNRIDIDDLLNTSNPLSLWGTESTLLEKQTKDIVILNENCGIFSNGEVPTKSHSFNLFWKIKRKHTIIMDPGSTHKHVFVYKPKRLISQEEYDKVLKIAGDETAKYTIAKLTHGTLFGIKGQIAMDSSKKNDHNYVNNLEGKMAIKKITNYTLTYLQNNITVRYIDTSVPDEFEGHANVLTDLQEIQIETTAEGDGENDAPPAV